MSEDLPDNPKVDKFSTSGLDAILSNHKSTTQYLHTDTFLLLWCQRRDIFYVNNALNNLILQIGSKTIIRAQAQ